MMSAVNPAGPRERHAAVVRSAPNVCRQFDVAEPGAASVSLTATVRGKCQLAIERPSSVVVEFAGWPFEPAVPGGSVSAAVGCERPTVFGTGAGEVEGAALVQGLAIQTLWVVLFAALSRVLLRAGYRRYSGFGG